MASDGDVVPKSLANLYASHADEEFRNLSISMKGGKQIVKVFRFAVFDSILPTLIPCDKSGAEK